MVAQGPLLFPAPHFAAGAGAKRGRLLRNLPISIVPVNGYCAAAGKPLSARPSGRRVVGSKRGWNANRRPPGEKGKKARSTLFQATAKESRDRVAALTPRAVAPRRARGRGFFDGDVVRTGQQGRHLRSSDGTNDKT